MVENRWSLSYIYIHNDEVLNIIFLCNVASCECSYDDLIVTQSTTGRQVESQIEWEVKIENNCTCTQLDVKLDCEGFQTAEPIDSSVLAKSGDECLLNNGLPVYGHSIANFTYAWNTSFPFKAISSQIACS